jgi:glycosyltransferase involved in cell wall biosynthesis
LNHLLTELLKRKLKIVLTLHAASRATADVRPYAETLNQLSAVIVHAHTEVASLKSAGINNVQFMVLGNILAPYFNREQLKSRLGVSKYSPIIATHGLLTNLKGIGQLITAAAELREQYPDLLLILLNAVSSNNVSSQAFYQEYQQLASSSGLADQTLFIPDFLAPADILPLLKLADVNVLAYDDNGEGASAAIQRMIAVDQPMILTDVPAFQTMKELAVIIGSNQPENIIKAIGSLLNDDAEQKRQRGARKDYLNKHNWFAKHVELMRIYLE